MTRLGARISRPCLRSEGGFALVEVMVSAVLLVVLSLSTFSLLDRSASQSASNRARAIAVSLAEQDQDRLRAIPFTELADLDASQPKTIRGITYTIASKAQYASDAAGIVPCAESAGAVQYLQVGTTVTWPNMGATRPVRIESLVTPNVGNVNLGSLLVVMKRANGNPLPDIAVTVAGVTKITDAGGCARWSNLTPGSYTVAFGTPGYLTPAGAESFSENVSVLAKQTSNKSYAYDQAAGIDASFQLRDGSPETWRSATVASGSSAQTRPASVGTTPVSSISFSGLYPFTDGYKAFAGRCTGNDPTTYKSDFFTTNPGGAVIPVPGNPVSVNALMRKVRLQVTKINRRAGNALSSGQVQLRISPSGTGMTGCESVARKKVGVIGPPNGTNATAEFPATSENFGTTTNANGVPRNTVIFDVPLPYGVWDICVDNSNSRRKVLVAYRNTPDGGSPAPDAVTLSVDLGGTTDIARKTTSPTEPVQDYNASNC